MLHRLVKAMKIQSFQMRLIFTAVACILIPSIISYSMSNFLVENKVREKAIGNANQTLQVVDRSVSNLFKFMLYVENYIMLDDAEIGYVLKNRALGLDNTEPGFSKVYDTQLVINKLDLLSAAGERCKITIILPDNQYFTNYGSEELDPADWQKEPWFAELKNMKGFDTYWISAQPTKFKKFQDNHPYQLSVARTLQTTSSKIYAYVIVTIFEDQVSSLFSNEDGNNEIMMVNDKGVIQSSSNSARVGTFVDYVSNDSSVVVKNGKSYLLTERKLDYSNWKLISLTPYKDAISNITGIYSHVLIYQIMFFVIFLLVLIYLISKFTKPLRHLGKVAKTVYRGNLNVRSNIRGGDEIGMLGLSFDQMLERINQMILQITREQSKKREAELAMLQAQIRPHFLFNVLNSIRMRIFLRGDQESAEIIASLSKLLRMTFERDKSEITLIEEIYMSEDYVKLMNMRREDQVHLAFNIEKETLSKRVPRFILQPLIENAIIHGFEQRGGTVIISSESCNGGWSLTVFDDGLGMEPEVLDKVGRLLHLNHMEIETVALGSGFSSIGIANVNERLRMTYGEKFSMKIDSSPEKGTRIRMSIPDKEMETP